MRYTRQVTQHVALQYSDECKAGIMAEISVNDSFRFVWTEESGCDKYNCARKDNPLVHHACP